MASKIVSGNINSNAQNERRGEEKSAHLFKSASISASRCVGVIPKEKSEVINSIPIPYSLFLRMNHSSC